jgi:hypothetical protein
VDQQQLNLFEELPRTRSHRLIDFEQAEVVTLESFPPRYLLVVRGTKPYLNMRVRLAPLTYIQQPEYWGIEVVGKLHGGIGLPVMTPYTASIHLDGITGTEGVEVLGATRSERLKVPPEEKPGNCGGWEAWHDREPPGPAVLHVQGQCRFPTTGYSVELKRREPQGINPRDLLLERVVHEPTGPVTQVLTTVDVAYQEETEGPYDTVTIVTDGVTIPVQEVQ